MGEIREAIRSNLERYISESIYSQKEIAEKLGVSKSSITNWIKGKNSPDVELVVPICRLLNISVRDFFGEPSDRQEPKSFPNTSETTPKEKHLIELYHELNQEGQEKLLDYADDLVSSGKYIKIDSDKLGKAKNA